MNIKLITAQVISIQDPDKRGRIRVRPIPDLVSVEDDLLPWVVSFKSNAYSEDEFSLDLPPIGAFVWVFFLDEMMYQQGYWIGQKEIDGLLNYSKVEQALSDIEELGNYQYSQLQFTYNNESIHFHNTVNGDYGFLHRRGSYYLFSASGDLIHYSANKIHIYNDNAEIELNMSGKILLSNPEGNIELSPSGGILLKNNGGEIDFNPSGRVLINGHLEIMP